MGVDGLGGDRQALGDGAGVEALEQQAGDTQLHVRQTGFPLVRLLRAGRGVHAAEDGRLVRAVDDAGDVVGGEAVLVDGMRGLRHDQRARPDQGVALLEAGDRAGERVVEDDVGEVPDGFGRVEQAGGVEEGLDEPFEGRMLGVDLDAHVP